MAFRRKLFDPQDTEPFKLSRSKIELYIRCPFCFYLDRRLGIPEPPGYPFSLNAAVDFLLKKEFDQYRQAKKPHPLMIEAGIEAIPFGHPALDDWRENFKGVRYLHEPTNLLITGAVDDLWVNPKGEVIVVDYKATSKDAEVNLDAEWQRGYKNQMEIYQWLVAKNGLRVNPTGYFVYANGRRDLPEFDGRLEFNIKVIPYLGKTDWIEPKLEEIKKCLLSEQLPPISPSCPLCAYRQTTVETLKKRYPQNGQIAFW